MQILAVDPAMANFGMAKFDLNLETLKLDLIRIKLVQTEKTTAKVVRANSDKLRRAQEIRRAFFDEAHGCHYVFAEIPSGAQSAGAAYAFGMQVGILACSPAEVIQVMPNETKFASVGRRTASKAEIICWARDLYPDADWLTYERKTTKHDRGDLHEDNEHCADACAIAHAGLLTDEFRRLRSMMLSAERMRAA